MGVYVRCALICMFSLGVMLAHREGAKVAPEATASQSAPAEGAETAHVMMAGVSYLGAAQD